MNITESDYFDVIAGAMIQNKIFTPIALQLIETKVEFENDENFDKRIKEWTFAYFDPKTNSVHINMQDKKFIKKENKNFSQLSKVFFMLYHELMHKILNHDDRLTDKEPRLWNIACDMEIHNLLVSLSSFFDENEISCSEDLSLANFVISSKRFLVSNENCFMYEPKYKDLIAEEIYIKLFNQCDEISFESFENEKGQKTTVSTMKNKKSCTSINVEDDKDDSGGIDENEDENPSNDFKNMSGKKDEEKENTSNESNESKDQVNKSSKPKKREKSKTQQIAESMLKDAINEQLESSRGAGSCNTLSFLNKFIYTKVDWKRILSLSLNSFLKKDELLSWSKPRISLFGLPGGYILPSILDEETYGKLYVCIDESGSISDDTLRRACSVIKQAGELYSKIEIVKHDTKISFTKEFEEINEEAEKEILTRHSCGGTSHKEIFKYINEKSKHDEEISCVICITDMDSDIEIVQDNLNSYIPVIYLYPDNYGIGDEHNSKIKGLKIPIS